MFRITKHCIGQAAECGVTFFECAMSRIYKSNHSDGITIKIGSTKPGMLIVTFGVFWLTGWWAGLVAVLSSLIDQTVGIQTPFILVWAVGWFFAGCLFVFLSVWHMYGYERIRVKKHGLVIDYVLLGLSFGGRFRDDIDKCTNLRAVGYFDGHKNNSSWLYNVMGIGDGVITFEYLSQRFRFGRFLSETEADEVVCLLKPHFKM